MEARDQYLAGRDGRLRYRDEGAGRALVFLHAWTLDLEAWDAQAAALAGTLRVVRFDRRGFGLSEGTPGLAADLADLPRLLDHLGLERPALVGHSQGARSALAFALRHPERVSALVLDGPPDETGAAPAAEEEEFSIAEFRALARERGIEAFRAAWGRHALMRLYGGDPRARARLDRLLARYPGRDLLAPPPPPPVVGAAALARLSVPVLVINGEHEAPGRRRAGEAIARALANAERVVLPGCGHLPNFDDPDAYNAAIQAFLRRQPRAAA